MLSDEQWSELEPLIEACRPHAKVPSPHLRRTIEAILWRHQNGAKWRSLPAEFGPWWMAAQIFIRWARLGVWEKLLALVHEWGVRLGMVFLDGTNILAHQKAAGASRKGDLQKSETAVKRLADLVVAISHRASSSRPANPSDPVLSFRGNNTLTPTYWGRSRMLALPSAVCIGAAFATSCRCFPVDREAGSQRYLQSQNAGSRRRSRHRDASIWRYV